MYCITDEQVAYILNDIRRDGVEMEDLQLNLLDHICCIIEQEFKENDDFELFYRQTLKRLCNKDLYEIEVETINLLTFKNYYIMKKSMMISGTASVALLIFGSFFKIMHWPGASALLSAGIVLLGLVFLPLIAIIKTREADKTAEKITSVSGTLMGILFCMAIMFAVQHWPGARSGVYWLIAVGFSLFVFIPVYFFTGIRNPEKRMNTIIISILLVGFSCLQFTMIGLRQPVPQLPIYTYLSNEQILHNLQRTENKNATPENRKLVADINNACEQLKKVLIERDIDATAIPDDFEQKQIVISEKLVDLRENYVSRKLLTDLKLAVSSYNANLTDGRIPTEHSILGIPDAQLAHTTNLFILNSLTQLQINLAMGGTMIEKPTVQQSNSTIKNIAAK